MTIYHLFFQVSGPNEGIDWLEEMKFSSEDRRQKTTMADITNTVSTFLMLPKNAVFTPVIHMAADKRGSPDNLVLSQIKNFVCLG